MLSKPRYELAPFLLMSLVCIACQPSENTNLEANKQVVRDLFLAIDAQDYYRLRELFPENAVVYMAGSDEVATQEVMLQVIPAFYAAFPDYHHVVEDMVAEGDLVAARITYRGTHQSDFEGIPATGNSVTYSGMQFFRIVDGAMLESWLIEDNLSFMTQLGLELSPAEAES